MEKAIHFRSKINETLLKTRTLISRTPKYSVNKMRVLLMILLLVSTQAWSSEAVREQQEREIRSQKHEVQRSLRDMQQTEQEFQRYPNNPGDAQQNFEVQRQKIDKSRRNYQDEKDDFYRLERESR